MHGNICNSLSQFTKLERVGPKWDKIDYIRSSCYQCLKLTLGRSGLQWVNQSSSLSVPAGHVLIASSDRAGLASCCSGPCLGWQEERGNLLLQGQGCFLMLEHAEQCELGCGNRANTKDGYVRPENVRISRYFHTLSLSLFSPGLKWPTGNLISQLPMLSKITI